MTAFPEFHKYDGLGLAQLVRARKVSSAELLEEAISRIETVNPKINAVIYKMYDRARQAALGKLPEGPFTGVPFLLKDIHATSFAGYKSAPHPLGMLGDKWGFHKSRIHSARIVARAFVPARGARDQNQPWG
jgi:hypothetical protein